MVWHEDFEDEPSVEARMPFGIFPEEMHAVMMEASLDFCEFCGIQSERDDLIETETYEFYTMDLDPGTLICADCLETRRLSHIPEELSLIDAYSPVERFW